MSGKPWLTAHGRKQIRQLLLTVIPWMAAGAAVLVTLAGCQTIDGIWVNCQTLPDGTVSCAGEVDRA